MLAFSLWDGRYKVTIFLKGKRKPSHRKPMCLSHHTWPLIPVLICPIRPTALTAGYLWLICSCEATKWLFSVGRKTTRYLSAFMNRGFSNITLDKKQKLKNCGELQWINSHDQAPPLALCCGWLCNLQ